MGRRNTTWVLWRHDAKPNAHSEWVQEMRIGTKKNWQATAAFYRRPPEQAALVWGIRGSKYEMTHLAESRDKEVLLSMLDLLKE